MFGIWVYLEDYAFVPAFLISKFGIKIDLNPITGLDRFGHGLFFSICKPEQSCTDQYGDGAVDCPLRIACHITARQNVDALQYPNSARKHEQDSNDLKNDFND